MKYDVSSRERVRLLLVDDEAWFVEALALRLEMRGFETSIALDAAQALRKFREEDFDAVILDLRLPDRDGSEVLRDMLELDPGAWIAILTGHGGDEDRETCLEIGARAFFSKPMSAEALSEGVLQGLQEKADQARNDDA